MSNNQSTAVPADPIGLSHLGAASATVDCHEFEDLVSRVGRGEAKLCHLVTYLDNRTAALLAVALTSKSEASAAPAVEWTGEAVYELHRKATDKPHKQNAWADVPDTHKPQFHRMADALNAIRQPAATAT